MKFNAFNPSNRDMVWSGEMVSKHTIDTAVTKSKEALTEWAASSLESRIAIINNYKQVILDNVDALAACISESTGKPMWEALGEANAMAAKCEVSITAFHERCKSVQFETGTTQYQARFKPHGVMVVLGPYNFPGHIPNGHIVPSLIAGNTVLFKPSEFTPKVADLMAEFWQKAGLPPHVFKVLHGDGTVGANLCQHPGINGICFTGSSRVGTLIAQSVIHSPSTIVALEMGGNNPLIVHDVADCEAAALMVVQSAFLSAGQRCTCARKLILTPSAPAGLMEAVIELTQRLRIGPPNDSPVPFMGPLIHKSAVDAVIHSYDNSLKNGASSFLPPTRLDRPGCFVSPGIVDQTGVSRINDGECFGPLLNVYNAPSLDAAIEIANTTRYGLAAGLLGGNQEDFNLAYDRLNAGIINWNSPTTGASSKLPFGGIGDSGNHRPSAYFAADYCAYPVASTINTQCKRPDTLPIGINDKETR